MTAEKVIAILKYYPEIEGNIKFYRDRIKEYEQEYYTPCTSQDNDGQPKGKNHISRTTENIALNIPAFVKPMIDEYEEKIESQGRFRAAIIKEISRLKRTQKEIIFDRYINDVKWEQVAQRNNYSVRQCDNIRRDAITALCGYFEANDTIRHFDISA